MFPRRVWSLRDVIPIEIVEYIKDPYGWHESHVELPDNPSARSQPLLAWVFKCRFVGNNLSILLVKGVDFLFDRSHDDRSGGVKGITVREVRLVNLQEVSVDNGENRCNDSDFVSCDSLQCNCGTERGLRRFPHKT